MGWGMNQQRKPPCPALVSPQFHPNTTVKTDRQTDRHTYTSYIHKTEGILLSLTSGTKSLCDREELVSDELCPYRERRNSPRRVGVFLQSQCSPGTLHCPCGIGEDTAWPTATEEMKAARCASKPCPPHRCPHCPRHQKHQKATIALKPQC